MIDTKDLGIALVQHKNWKFLNGMMLCDARFPGWGGRIISSDPSIYVGCRRAAVLGHPASGDGVPFIQIVAPTMEVYPDLSDPATLGCVASLFGCLPSVENLSVAAGFSTKS